MFIKKYAHDKTKLCARQGRRKAGARMNPLTSIALKALTAAVVVVVLLWAYNEFIEYQQNIGYQRAVAEYNQDMIDAMDAADQRERELTQKVKEAQDEGLKREETIKTLAAAVGRSSAGLRDTTSTIRLGLPGLAVDAARQTADTALALFGECQERYGRLAEKADGHVNDVQTLEAAWPR